MKKTQLKPAQEKYFAKFCPKTQPIAGFSLLEKKITKNSLYEKKPGTLIPKLNFYP